MQAEMGNSQPPPLLWEPGNSHATPSLLEGGRGGGAHPSLLDVAHSAAASSGKRRRAEALEPGEMVPDDYSTPLGEVLDSSHLQGSNTHAHTYTLLKQREVKS